LRFLPAAVRRLLSQAVSSSRSDVPLQSAALPDPPRPRPCGFTAKHLPWGFFPHRGTSQQRLATGFPSPPQSIHGVSHALDGLLRHWPCGFISPHSHVQGSPSRGFPSRTAVAPRRRPVALASVDDGSLLTLPPAPLPVAPPSGLYSVRESVAESTVFSRRPDPIPSWAFLPPGSLSRRRANAFTSAVAHDLHQGSVESFPRLIFSVPSSSLAYLSRGCRPARSSRPPVSVELPRRLRLGPPFPAVHLDRQPLTDLET
jgi:hypothetical protein